MTLGVIPDELAARFWWKEEWRILPVIEVHDQHAACRGSLPSEDAAPVLLFSLVVSGQLELRRIDGWRKIGSVLSQHTAVAA